jgi:predicted hydrocarbon binding protein
MAKVKGGKIGSKLAFVKEAHGQEILDRVIASLPAADQTELKIVLEGSWYSYDLYERLIRAICELAGGGDEAIYTQMGHHSAERALRGTYKAFVGKNPTDLLQRSAQMHKMRNDPAEMEVLVDGPTRCVVKIMQPKSTVEICKVSKAFYERSVELAGGRDVHVREPQCMGRGDSLCRFEISWKT